MKRSTLRLLLFATLLLGVTLIATLVYQAGMAALEESPRGFWRSLMTVVETLTTTGFGADSHWDHPVMNILVIVLQFLGVIFVFLFFPLYLIPVMEERFQARLPVSAGRMRDHVILYGYRPAFSVLLDELDEAGVPALVLEEDARKARQLVEEGRRVVHGRVGEGGLAAAGLHSARALVAGARDEENASLALAAQQLEFEGEILALAESGSHRGALALAGCTEVFTPSYLQASALASRASEKVRPTVEGAHLIGRQLEVCEVRVQPGSTLAGKSLREAAVGRETGAQVLGQWLGGRLVTPPEADMVMKSGGVLVVAGSHESVSQLSQMAGTGRSLRDERPFVVVGYGEVGRRVVKFLREAGEEVVVVDRVEQEGVDRVGDVLDVGMQHAARLNQAQALILALDEDSSTLFATVMLRGLSATLPIFARVNEAANVDRIHRAGADFAIAVSQVIGRMLARRLLGDDSIAVDQQLAVRKLPASAYAGKRPAELDLRRRTGCTVIAVERGEDLHTRFDEGFRFESGDSLFLAGGRARLRELAREAGAEA